jgi:TorA maturation chaperone TorD
METVSTPVTTDLALLLARRTCYRFLASVLADPGTGGTFSELADPATRKLVAQAAEILRDEDAAVARPLALGESPLAELDPVRVFARLPKSASELNELYEANFGLLGGSKCPPYEIEYVPSKFTFQRSNMLADIAGFYSAFGLQTSSSNPDRPDHVVMEFEFLAQLLQLHLQTVEGSGLESPTQAAICQGAAERFLKEHVVWWLPAFAKVLARQNPGGFYEAVAHFLAAFVAAERALAHIEPPRHSVEPSPIENPDECSGCELAVH